MHIFITNLNTINQPGREPALWEWTSALAMPRGHLEVSDRRLRLHRKRVHNAGRMLGKSLTYERMAQRPTGCVTLGRSPTPLRLSFHIHKIRGVEEPSLPRRLSVFHVGTN